MGENRYLGFRDAEGVVPYEYAHCFVQTMVHAAGFCIGYVFSPYSSMTVGVDVHGVPFALYYKTTFRRVLRGNLYYSPSQYRVLRDLSLSGVYDKMEISVVKVKVVAFGSGRSRRPPLRMRALLCANKGVRNGGLQRLRLFSLLVHDRRGRRPPATRLRCATKRLCAAPYTGTFLFSPHNTGFLGSGLPKRG